MCTVLMFLSNLTQHQAGEAEKKIKAEFERLHQVLYREETRRLEALAYEEKQKMERMQRSIEDVEREIVELKNLIEMVKKEMGNEDLALLKVRKGSLFYCLILSWFFYYKTCFKANL